MNTHVISKLNEAEKTLGLKLPEKLFDFISGLNQPEVTLGNETWFFLTVLDDAEDANENYIIQSSLNFNKTWGLEGIVVADNGIGDYLVVLPEELQEIILVLMHETAELKLFGKNILEVIENGPLDYFWDDNFLYKLDDDNRLIKAKDSAKYISNCDSENYFGKDYDLRTQIDSWIDTEDYGKTSDILTGLKELTESNNTKHKIWSLNKLSDLYFKGYGPIQKDIDQALKYNQLAIDQNSHIAFANLAFCYFSGIGMNKDYSAALDYALKANELSKKNQFADLLSSKKEGGLYNDLINLISRELQK